MNPKKGQAALEFLTTYGWAIFAILAIIGILTYSGIADVSDKIPESCTFNTGVSCGAFYGLENGQFAFEITNMQRAPINITNVSCSYAEDTGDYIINLVEETVKVGDSAVIYCNPVSVAPELPNIFGGKHKFQAKIYYHFDEVDALPKVMGGDLVIGVSDDVDVLNQYITVAIPST